MALLLAINSVPSVPHNMGSVRALASREVHVADADGMCDPEQATPGTLCKCDPESDPECDPDKKPKLYCRYKQFDADAPPSFFCGPITCLETDGTADAGDDCVGEFQGFDNDYTSSWKGKCAKYPGDENKHGSEQARLYCTNPGKDANQEWCTPHEVKQHLKEATATPPANAPSVGALASHKVHVADERGMCSDEVPPGTPCTSKKFPKDQALFCSYGQGGPKYLDFFCKPTDCTDGFNPNVIKTEGLPCTASSFVQGGAKGVAAKGPPARMWSGRCVEDEDDRNKHASSKGVFYCKRDETEEVQEADCSPEPPLAPSSPPPGDNPGVPDTTLPVLKGPLLPDPGAALSTGADIAHK